MIFLVILLVFDAYLSISLYGTVLAAAPLLGGAGIALIQLLMASQLWLFFVFFRSGPEVQIRYEDTLRKIAFYSMGLVSFLFTFTLLRDLASLASTPFREASLYTPAVAAGITLLSLLAFAAGAANARFRLVSPRIPVDVPGLPPALQGLRIVQLSDVHLGTGPQLAHVREMVDRALSLRPDLIALTGDIIDGNVAEIGPELREFARLGAPGASTLGAYFVIGNHECYWDHRDGIRAIRAAGITVLQNEGVALDFHGEKLYVAGINDPAAKHFNDEGPKVPVPPADSRLNLLLVHQPQLAKLVTAIAGPRYHLQLSGHTHGGQFFPWNWVVRAMYPVHQGLGRAQDLRIYVSSGTGYWGPPIRLGTDGEVTELIAQAAGGAGLTAASPGI